MIDQIDEQLRAWIRETLDVPPPSLSPPDDAQKDRGVNLYLLELVDKPPTRGTRRTPLQIALRYLVTTWADEPEEAHRLLGELVFAAMEKPDLEVELEPIPATTWAALGVKPRPSFVLRVPLQLERPEAAVKLVREPLVVQDAPSTSLRGIVLGPGDAPLARALVELPVLRVSTHTDARGQFEFSNVPGKPFTRRLYVRAKGRELDVTLEQTVEPIVIRFDSFE